MPVIIWPFDDDMGYPWDAKITPTANKFFSQTIKDSTKEPSQQAYINVK